MTQESLDADEIFVLRMNIKLKKYGMGLNVIRLVKMKPEKITTVDQNIK